MPLSLHAAYVPSALQMLGTARHLVDKAEGWCGENAIEEAEIIGTRLAPDMLPWSYQVKCVAEHTQGAIDGVRAGVYSPDLSPPPDSFEGLRIKLAGAVRAIEALSEEEMEGFVGQDMRFEFRERRLDFLAEDFLLSFSQPNFYFHCATAYDILRMKGTPVGKSDFIGQARVRP